MEWATDIDPKISIPFLEQGVINWESDPLSAYLVSSGKIRESELHQVENVTAVRTEALGISLVKYGILSEKDLAVALNHITGIPVLDTNSLLDEIELPDSISIRFLKNNHVVPVKFDESHILLAMAEPRDYETIQSLSLALSSRITPVIGLYSEIQKRIDELDANRGNKKQEHKLENEARHLDQDDISRLRDIASEAPVIRTVNGILQYAIELRASDIHLEPFADGLKVRYRVDGMLRVEKQFPAHLSAPVNSRIKIMANMDIAESRLPQDGRIQIKITGRELDIRVSTLPTMYGESVVIRVLDKEAVILDFDTLGFDEYLQQKITEKLSQPNGVILVTGPTGSGKTTTLYTALNQINTEDRKIITVEDPIEYQLDGINQVAVKPKIGLDFSTVLRSVLRQDPDIIMVGEMRDRETAKIAVQAALTGHLVLSTLHTNDAVSGVTRLLDMGVEDYLVTATVTSILAQRLVRKLCEVCKTPAGDSWHATGCDVCKHTGYRGRLAICEIFELSDVTRQKIIQGASYEELRKQARDEGMLSMYEHGMKLVAAGKTTAREVLRVTAQ